MTASQQAKMLGIKTLPEVTRLTDIDSNTLTKLHKNKPWLFKNIVLWCLNKTSIEYGNWTIEHKPKSARGNDWYYMHVEHSGDRWNGVNNSLIACIDEIDNIELNIEKAPIDF